MIDINLIRKDPDRVRKAIIDKQGDISMLEAFLRLDKKWREITKEIDDMRAELNTLSKERAINAAKLVKKKVRGKEEAMKEIESERQELLFQFPNIPDVTVPIGKDERSNVVIKTVGKTEPQEKDYLTLAERLNLIDIKRSAKVAGSRFGYLKNEAVLLEFALIQFAFTEALKKGFFPIIPPVMVKPELLVGIGKRQFIQNEDAFYVKKDNLYLAGSAEHTIAPMHSDEVFTEKELPLRYIGFSTCFRREAGSHGKDTKGILRVHQFDKVELFSYVKPEDSQTEHKFLVSFQEELLQALKLPYRVVQIATGDMGFSDANQIDIETWIPSENTYRETHSASNTTDFQARGVHIKYRKRDSNSSEFVHMLNATGFAVGRMLIAIIENYQTKQGTIKVPRVLVPFSGFKEIKLK
jgi:seryl-tRNA synthetase